MAFAHGHTPAHKGKSTTADPVMTSEVVAQIKDLLQDKPRDLALWTLATNSMLRAGDLLNIQWDDIEDDGNVMTLTLLEGKTKKRRVIPLAPPVSTLLRIWRELCASEFVFSGQRGQLTTAAWSRLIKSWCQAVGLEGNFSSHTARKTGVRIRYDEHDVSLATLMHCLNHTSESTTLIYMGRMQADVAAAYAQVV